ncbi:MAG: PQQ-binding-like beta-propeller repeat protein [Gemmataceae bacterium]
MYTTERRNILFSWLVAAGLLLGHVQAQEWTRFRGPNGSGIGEAQGLPVRFTEKDFAWKIALPGVGHGSPVVWGERVFLTSGDEETGTRYVLCHRAADGKQLWQREFPGQTHRKHAHNSLASATPVVDDRYVYASFAAPTDYLVVALTHDGKEVWQRDLGPYKAGHGAGGSMIVVDDLLIVPNEQEGNSSILALERDTGKERWKTERRSKATYSTPCLYQPAGKPAELILTNWDHGITSLDPRTGKTLWEMDVFDKGHIETAISSPIVTGNLVLGTCGWLGVKKEVIAVDPSQRGPDGQGKPVYRIERSAPLVPTPLVVDDLLFLWADEGIVTCADARTGEVFWRERVPGTYYGSPVAVGKHIYGISREGDVMVLAAKREFELLARNPLDEASHSTPAMAGGRMFLRTFSHLIAIGGGERE